MVGTTGGGGGTAICSVHPLWEQCWKEQKNKREHRWFGMDEVKKVRNTDAGRPRFPITASCVLSCSSRSLPLKLVSTSALLTLLRPAAFQAWLKQIAIRTPFVADGRWWPRRTLQQLSSCGCQVVLLEQKQSQLFVGSAGFHQLSCYHKSRKVISQQLIHFTLYVSQKLY